MAKVKIKFNPVRDVIHGKSVVVVDDSLVRGNTSQSLVQMIRAAGAREVHLRLASPPITGPCHYGIDTPTREELIASTHSIEEIRQFLGVDSLGYLSLDGHAARRRQHERVLPRLLLGPLPHPGSGGPGAAPPRLAAHRDSGMSGPYTQPLVYFFGQGRADGTAAMKEILGGKGAGLAEMTTIGIPVPPGFTIASSLCLHYLESRQFPKRLRVEVENTLQRLETATGKHFGDGDNPLLVSVRSGAAVSMPGMMETILNLGLNDATVEGLTRQSGNPRFAWDSYRRFVQMYGTVVFDLPKQPFEHILEEQRQRLRGGAGHRPAGRGDAGAGPPVQGARPEGDRPRVPRRPACGSSGARSRRCSRAGTPAGPSTTGSSTTSRTRWAPRSTSWRWSSATWARIRAPASPSAATPRTGEQELYGEYLLNAQGEDVVSGSRTPAPDRHAQGAAARLLPGAGAGRAHPGAALPRRAGHGVHHRARHALHAADPPGAALGPRRGPDRLRDGGRRADLRGGGGRPDPAQRPEPAPPPHPRPAEPSSTCSPPACPPRRARPAAPSCSTPTGPSSWAEPASR